MRAIWAPAPDVATLAGLPVHIVARDFPEALAPLRALGLDPRGCGARALRAAAGERLAEVSEALSGALAWRPPAPPPGAAGP